MKIIFAFVATVVIWGTTPLAIAWSAAELHPMLAALLRMVLAVTLGLPILAFTGLHLPRHGHAWRNYALGSIGIFGAMALTYFSTLHIPTGLVSLMFGLSPLTTGLIAWLLRYEAGFSRLQLIAVFVTVGGFSLIVLGNGDYLQTSMAWVMISFLATLLFSLSSVMVKQFGTSLHPMQQGVGSMLVAIPGYALAWLVMAPEITLPIALNQRTLGALLYLSIMASLVGFYSFFYLLKALPSRTAALVTLAAPVIGLLLGHWLNAEPLNLRTITGAAIVLAGLLWYLSLSRHDAPTKTGSHRQTATHKTADRPIIP